MSHVQHAQLHIFPVATKQWDLADLLFGADPKRPDHTRKSVENISIFWQFNERKRPVSDWITSNFEFECVQILINWLIGVFEQKRSRERTKPKMLTKASAKRRTWNIEQSQLQMWEKTTNWIQINLNDTNVYDLRLFLHFYFIFRIVI